jgi:restriction system protein
MPIPGFQKLMLPLLKATGDSQEHTFSGVIEILATQFGLTEEERKELLPSGISRFDNRVGWARTHLKKAGLIESTERGKFRITERGIGVLKANPPEIKIRYLMQFPEFVEFRNVSRQSSKQDEKDEEPAQTPEENLTLSYQNLRRDLAQELLERIKQCSPRFFEKLVIDLLIAMGYGGSREDAGQAIGQSGDDGIDGIIKEDKLGLDAVYI